MEEAWQVGGVKHAGGKFRVKFAVKLLTEASTNHNAPWIRTAGISRDSPGSCRTPCGLFLLALSLSFSLALSPSISPLSFSLFTLFLSLFPSLTDWGNVRSVYITQMTRPDTCVRARLYTEYVYIRTERIHPGLSAVKLSDLPPIFNSELFVSSLHVSGTRLLCAIIRRNEFSWYKSLR